MDNEEPGIHLCTGVLEIGRSRRELEVLRSTRPTSALLIPVGAKLTNVFADDPVSGFDPMRTLAPIKSL